MQVSQKCPWFSDLWKRMRDLGFKLFPAVHVVVGAGLGDNEVSISG
jgi:hypothetical protein